MASGGAVPPVRAAGEGANAVRVLAKVGSTPNQAQALELRPKPDGTLAAWHGGHEVLDFESGEPVVLPAGTGNAAALDAIKASGAFGKRSKYFDVAADEDTQQPAAETPVSATDEGKPAPKAKQKPDPAPAPPAADVPVSDVKADATAPGEPKAPAAKAQPAPPVPRETKSADTPKATELSDSEAFAEHYASFEGKTVEQSVQLSDTGETATLRIDAAKAMRELDARLKTLTELRGCIGRHA